MNKTQIEWVRNPDGTQGYTWNPITGCLNHINGLCKGGGFPCYAYKLANGRLKDRYLANLNIAPTQNQPFNKPYNPLLDPFYPRLWPERLPKDKFHYFGKLKQVKPRGIFICDMGELFGDWVPREWQEQIFRVIIMNPWHRFYLLTKQPQNLIKFSPFPDNCWVGVTVTRREQYSLALASLLSIQAKRRYISFEPLLEQIDIRAFDFQRPLNAILHWFIIGAQTKPYKPPKIEWVEEIVRAADKAGVPVFLKDNLGHCLQYGDNLGLTHRPDGHGVLVVRQEMPV